jgi:hypothetical protein
VAGVPENDHVGVGTSGAVVDDVLGTGPERAAVTVGEGADEEREEEEGVAIFSELEAGIEEGPGAVVGVGTGAIACNVEVDAAVGVGTGTGFNGTKVQPGGTTTPLRFGTAC